MMYLLTEAQHAQILSAYTEDWGDIEQAVAMLKAMQPVSLVAWQYKTNEAGLFVSDQCPADVEVLNDIEWSKPLYTPEQSK
jgi:hypothetical protein